MCEEKINVYFDAPERRAELVEAISRLVRIHNVREGPLLGMPFGPGPAAALVEGLKLAEELGFATRDCGNCVGTADLNDKETVLHILCRLDVVGEGTGWAVTEPYALREVDDMLYGRGIDDDKGPVAAVLLAMKAVKGLGVPLRRNACLLMGTDEESGSSDIAYYYARESHAPYAFSSGTEFPLISIEKGSYKPVFTKSWPAETTAPRATEFRGGFRINVFPPEAERLVAGLSADAARSYCDRAAAETGVRYELREKGDSLHILYRGKGVHASLPEEGVNAITGLLRPLCSLSLAKVGPTAALRALSALFPHGDCAGKALGIAQSNELSGTLTLAFFLLTVNDTDLEGQFNSRVPICVNDENYRTAAEASSSKFGFSVSGEMDAPHHTSADSPLVKTLLKCYEQYTNYKGKCPAIGGGTYVHDIPGGVAFSRCVSGFNGNMHGADEHTCIADQLTAAKIFIQATIDLCGWVHFQPPRAKPMGFVAAIPPQAVPHPVHAPTHTI